MNANELADILEVFPNMNVVKAATMLRQQQAEIEALKTLLNKGCLDSKSYVIGWEDGKSTACACGEPLSPNTVHKVDSPCYVKEELTDEEIVKIYCEIGGNKEWASGYVYWREFARAILRKAQEK